MDRITAARVFIETVERGSATAAADALDMSRAMASRYIASIEDWSETRLLHRTTRRLSLTSAGERVLDLCKDMVRIADSVSDVAEDAATPRGRLRVTAPTILADALLIAPGDRIAAGEVTYPGLKAVALQRGVTLDPIAMDAGGLIPEDFARLCAVHVPKALYLTPSIDNPTTLSEARRLALAEIARRHGVAIIEDDPYALLRSMRMASMLTLAPDLTWHLATPSKCVKPALRVAFVVAPDGYRALRLASVLRATIMMAPPLFLALASNWIQQGIIDDIAAAVRAENRLRQALAAEALRGANFAADPEGHHLWLSLPDHWRASEFAEHADRAGLSIVPATAFAIGNHQADRVRISLGVAPDRDVLEEGLLQLAALMERPSITMRAVV